MAADFADHEFVEEDGNDFDIVIVGAGLSGLTCAYNILKKAIGLSVLIIEAKKEIGGRILSRDLSENFHANFLQTHITKLIRLFRIKTYKIQNDNVEGRVFYTKYGPTEYLSGILGAEVYHFFQTIENNAVDPRFHRYNGYEDAEHLAETSVEELLRKLVVCPCARELCRAFVCSICATRNLNNVSALWLLVMLNGASGLVNRLKFAIGDDNRYFIQGGATQIAQELLKKILHERGEIRYVESVSEIVFNDDRAYVKTNKSYIKCEYVIVAVPPPLHDQIVIKPLLESFPKPHAVYAPAENVFFNIAYKKSLLTGTTKRNIITTWDSNSNLNILYHGTPRNADRILLAGYLDMPNSTQAHRKDLFDTLNESFQITNSQRCEVYREYNPMEFNDSSGDQFVAGTPMSFLKPTSISNHANVTGKCYGRVFFASSEYASNWPGTVDGAIESGEVTAYSILSRLRPQALTFEEISSTLWQRSYRVQTASFKMFTIYSIGLIINIAIFIPFFKNAYYTSN